MGTKILESDCVVGTLFQNSNHKSRAKSSNDVGDVRMMYASKN